MFIYCDQLKNSVLHPAIKNLTRGVVSFANKKGVYVDSYLYYVKIHCNIIMILFITYPRLIQMINKTNIFK